MRVATPHRDVFGHHTLRGEDALDSLDHKFIITLDRADRLAQLRRSQGRGRLTRLGPALLRGADGRHETLFELLELKIGSGLALPHEVSSILMEEI